MGLCDHYGIMGRWSHDVNMYMWDYARMGPLWGEGALGLWGCWGSLATELWGYEVAGLFDHGALGL